MGDEDYVRLTPVRNCKCGEPVKPYSGIGRRATTCGRQHHYQKKVYQPVKCAGCSGEYTPKRTLGDGLHFCSHICAIRNRRGNKPADLVQTFHCRHCGEGFQTAAKVKVLYCSNKCKQAAWARSNAHLAVMHRVFEPPKPKVVKKRTRNPVADKVGSRLYLEKLHRQAAKVVACDECRIKFCPLYGASHMRLCPCCKASRARAAKSAQKAIRRAAQVANPIDPYKVFHRDGWKCWVCGIPTPIEKRGSYDNDAPELDHVVPLSKGGPHTYDNVRCCCRKCNAEKSDKLGYELA